MARTPIQDLIRENERALVDALGSGGAVQEVGDAVVRYMVRRTRNLGRDKYLQRFTPYAPSTRKRKRRKGQRMQPVSLTDTGQMLDDLQAKPVGRSWGTEVIEAEIRFGTRRSQEIARIHANEERPRTKIPLRAFIGLSEGDPMVADFRDTLRRRVDAQVPGDRRRTVKLNVIRLRGGVI